MSALYPIRGKRKTYNGSNQTKIEEAKWYNSTAAAIEKHVNDQIRSGKRGVFTYAEIAHELCLDKDLVSDILFCVDCGNTGFTIPSDSDI